MTTYGTTMPDPSLGHGAAGPLAIAKRSAALQDSSVDKFGEEGTKRQAWLREMERAQLAGWFVTTGRDAFRNEFAVKNPVRLEPQHSPAAFVSERGFPYAAASEGVEPLDMAGEALGSAASAPTAPQDSSAPVQHRGVASETSDAVSKLAPNDVTGWAEQSVLSDAPKVPEGHRAAAAPLPGTDFSRGREHALLAARSAAAQESPVLPVRPSLIPPELPRLMSLPAMFRTEFVGSRQVDGMPNMRLALHEAEALDGASMPNVGTQRSTAARLHTQWTSEGLSLWIGMDGTARQVELQAQAIVTTLQRTLKSQGQRLSRVVCNGTVVFDDKVSEFGCSHLTDFSSFWKHEAHVRMSADISLSISKSSKET